MTDLPNAEQSWPTAAVSLGKDLVSLLRDGALFVLAVLLVAFPTQFNTILAPGSFRRFVGFK
jgi:hypothetical protein